MENNISRRAFTDRFLQVPIEVYNLEVKELTGKENLEESWMKFLPSELASYRPIWDDLTNSEWVNMVLKGGDVTVVHLSVQEFEHLLNHHI